MSYATWAAFNNASVIAVVTAPILLAIMVFLARRQHRDAAGRRNGRTVLWSTVTAVGSFFTLVFVWYLALQEAFPDHSARWRAESEQGHGQHGGEVAAYAGTIDGIVGRWRPNNRNRTDYLAFTDETWSSIHPDHDTTITYTYRVLRRDGPCMRIQSTSDKVIQAGTITQESARAGEPFTVCVDPETDQMLIRFDSDRGDVFFTRMD